MCCIPCRIHISCVTLHIKGPMYSHAFIYLNFARYISVLIMYVFVYGYKFRALLVMDFYVVGCLLRDNLNLYLTN